MTNSESKQPPNDLAPDADGSESDQDEAILDASFPIVGVGASAGGLEAFTQLLKDVPADAGLAFVLIQHLAPSHPSALSEILKRATSLTVSEVHDEPTVEANHVYVIPPDRSMVITGGKLHLRPRESGKAPHPVDQFFRSLAVDRRHRAIGVVLSGTATDGTIGLEAIKGEGGITFAQDSTAQYEGMPHSAIASGCVDFVLAPDAIAREILRIGRHPHEEPVSAKSANNTGADLAPVVHLLREATGVDFSNYKLNTLYRRISRRMIFQKAAGIPEYVQLLRQRPEEVEALYQDILINVTSFFRDPEAFETLKSKVFPRLLAGRARHDPVRIWTLGCSTGQEAYSLAMAFTEAAEAAGSAVPLQLFATDLNAAGVEKARSGVYPKDIEQDVSPERLARFFTEVDGRYRITKSIRSACVFSRHNVLADPPFSRIDMISCRNLLIYLEGVLQQRVMPTLHYALKPAGFLWLGGSETIGTHRNLFEAEDPRHKLYVKKVGSSPARGAFPLGRGGLPRVETFNTTPRPGEGVDLPREADRILSRFAPPGVIVTAEMDIVQYRGDTGPFLAPAPGRASTSLLKMLREGLLVPVRGAVLRAAQDGVSVRQSGLQVKSDSGSRSVTVEVIPLKGGGASNGGFLIVFESEGAVATPVPPSTSLAGESEVARLSQELAATHDYLQSVIEQQELTNEELQSAVEEARSANEELQSTNEELETSKEEIQSSNEELATVNEELHNRNDELNRANSDLMNLLGSVPMPIVILGADLRVRRFTPAAESLLNLIPSDIGRPLVDLKLNLEDLPDLRPLIEGVLTTAASTEREVRGKNGRSYSLRIHPYRTLDNTIDGAVLLLVDVTALREAYAYTESIVATVREPLIVLDQSLRVKNASRSFYETFRMAPAETEDRFLYELGHGEWDVPELRRLLEEILPHAAEVNDFLVERNFTHLGRRVMLVNARRLAQAIGQPPLLLLAIEDVTDRNQMTDQLRQNAADLSEADRNKNEFLAMLAHELRNPLAPIRNAAQLLRLTGVGDENVRKASDMLERQVSQMNRLVDDLLDVSRVSRGKIELRRGRMELGSVVHHAVEAARPLAESKSHVLSVTMPPVPVYLNADPTRLTQAIGNLLNNASKFTAPGGKIALTVEREGAYVIIRVRDQGIGIAADKLPRVFDLFMQVDTSLERTVSGLGIGLTLVKTLVELHGGTIEVTSAGQGLGSEFVIRLPNAGDVPPPPPEPIPESSSPPTGRRILVVDDNTDSAESLAMLLEMTGNELRIAHDGVAAVETAKAFRPDLVLLDIGLPKLNGYEAGRAIREQPWGRDIVLVALTGWGQEEDRTRSKAAGFNGHLVKPVDYTALLRLLAELLPTERPNSGPSRVANS